MIEDVSNSLINDWDKTLKKIEEIHQKLVALNN